MAQHVHYELMKLFLEDAAVSETPWTKWEHRAENKRSPRAWSACCSNPSWSSDMEYQRKTIKKVNGVDVPDIAITTLDPSGFTDAYVMSLCSDIWYTQIRLDNARERSQALISRGLCYPVTREGAAACQIHTKALIGLND